MTDQRDLERSLEDDLWAVYESLLWFWRRRGVPEADAQDAAQSGALKAYLKRSEWKGKSRRRTFMISVGKRAGLDYFRSENRQTKIKKRLTTIISKRALE